MKEFIRFFWVSVFGGVADIALAYAIATILELPLWIAAAAGFSVAAFGNYILHEVWTFRNENSRLSSTRALSYFITSGVILTSRLVVVSGLSAWISRDHTLLILIGGASVSFFVNYIISKFLVFSRGSENKGHT